eukprot:TRINITY_DN7403_c0_g1_i3.p2 TRINITY_DN7403_c0_g1~~TRINITY_DN7403_c0_g1_i3.p2  ORF type:complete len:122 (+),score=25.08 TRINITY_DN7403_c0_g1_i3:50-415(+)
MVVRVQCVDDSAQCYLFIFFFFQAEDGIRDHAQSRGLGDVYKRQDLTGSVVSVSSESLKEVPTSSIVQAMQGKVPGIFIQSNPTPGSKASIKIRGNNSIQYGTNPIFVIDGLVIDLSLIHI